MDTSLRLMIYLQMLVCLTIAVVLSILPMPRSINLMQPNWVLLCLIYFWLQPHKLCGLGMAWLIGLLLDSLMGTNLGIHAALLVIIGYLTLKSSMRISVWPKWQQILTVFLLLSCYQLFSLFVFKDYISEISILALLISLVSGAALWPLIYSLLSSFNYASANYNHS